MPMRTWLFAATIGCLAGPAHAQDSLPGPFQLDRPDQTECPYIVPKGYIQIESGVSIEQVSEHERTLVHPSSLWKFGLNNMAELRLITEFSTSTCDSIHLTGLSPVTVGFKVRICEEKGLIPKTSFIGHLTVPYLASEELKLAYHAPAFRFTMQHTLTDRLGLAYNLGAEWDGMSAEPTFIYTLTSGFSLTDHVGLYAEVYGFIPQQHAPDHRYDGGITWNVSPWCILDLSGGGGITKNAPDWYAALGFSFRFRP
jgi:hypothetical protein